MNFSRLCYSARSLQPDLATRVTRKILPTRYLPVVEQFIEFAVFVQDVCDFDFPEELGNFIKWFGTVAGLEHRESLNGRRSADPVQYTVPNTTRTACLMAAAFVTPG